MSRRRRRKNPLPAQSAPQPGIERQYAAAQTDRLTGDWRPVNSGINDLLKSSRPTILARTRQLVRDFGYFSRAKRAIVNFRIGDGIVLQSRVRDLDAGQTPGKIKLNTRLCQQIEDCWKWFCDDCDASGRLHYFDLERLWASEDVEAGESLLVMRWEQGAGHYLPLSLQSFEAEWLSAAPVARIAPDTFFDQGIELDAATMRPVAYHFAVPSGYAFAAGGRRAARIPARFVLHGFETVRAGQVRGIGPLTSAIILADDLRDCLDSTIDRFKMASRWLAFVQTENPMDWQRQRSRPGDDGHRVIDMQNAVMEFLKPGETVNINNADIPGGSFTPFVAFILRTLSITADIPYELLTGDYGGLNYNTMRVLRSDFKRMRRPAAKRHIRQFCTPVFRAMLDAAHLAGRLDLPGYWKNPSHYWDCIWQEPGQDPLDLLRESRAYTELCAARQWSPQEVIYARGRNPEDVLDECAEWESELKKRGLEQQAISKSLQTNPAAVMETSAAAIAAKSAQQEENDE